MSNSCILCDEPAENEKSVQKQFWTAVALSAALWALLVIGTVIA